MKTALLLSGFPRNFKYAFPYLKKYILDPLCPDVFYFGYNDLKHSITTEDVLSRYQPKKHCIREYNQEIEDEVWSAYGTKQMGLVRLDATEGPRTQPYWILSQYYNILKTNELKKQTEEEGDFKYDCVIRGRPDYFFYRDIEQEELRNIKPNHVYIPDIWDFDGVCDMFAYGDSSAMDKYCDLFRHVKRYHLESKCLFHPETLLKFHIHIGQQLERVKIKNHYWMELQDFVTNGFKAQLISPSDPENCPHRRDFT
jgi:hypothetical protein